jgi:hypothetical protein
MIRLGRFILKAGLYNVSLDNPAPKQKLSQSISIYLFAVKCTDFDA